MRKRAYKRWWWLFTFCVRFFVVFCCWFSLIPFYCCSVFSWNVIFGHYTQPNHTKRFLTKKNREEKNVKSNWVLWFLDCLENVEWKWRYLDALLDSILSYSPSLSLFLSDFVPFLPSVYPHRKSCGRSMHCNTHFIYLTLFFFLFFPHHRSNLFRCTFRFLYLFFFLFFLFLFYENNIPHTKKFVCPFLCDADAAAVCFYRCYCCCYICYIYIYFYADTF